MEEIKTGGSRTSAPFFRLPDTPVFLSCARLAALAAAVLFGTVFFGGRVIALCVSGVIGGSAAYLLWQLASGRRERLLSVEAAECGVMCALLLPASVPVWLPMLAAAFGVGVSAMPFGGFGRSGFSPAAAGGCFALLLGARLGSVITHSAANDELLNRLGARAFDSVSGSLPLLGDVEGIGSLYARLSPLMLLRAGESVSVPAGQLLLGGQKGWICAALVPMLIAAAVLVITKTTAPQTAAAYLGAIAVISFLFPYDGAGRWLSPVYELLCGPTLFIALFIMGDVYSSPDSRTGRVIYGIAGGALAIWFRRAGTVEGAELFAALFMNALAAPVDALVWKMRRKGISFNHAKDDYIRRRRERRDRKEGRL